MRLAPENVKYIIIHSSHSKNPRPTDGVKLLNQVHRMQGAFSWDPGGPACFHHFIVRTDGTVEEGRPLDSPGNHTYGFNEQSISVCYMGGATRSGYPADTRTEEQATALRLLVADLQTRFPSAKVVTHAELTPQTARGCPGFTSQQL